MCVGVCVGGWVCVWVCVGVCVCVCVCSVCSENKTSFAKLQPVPYGVIVNDAAGSSFA